MIVSIQSFAQEINQLDSKGKRDGVWRKNFDSTDVLRYEGAFKHGKEVGLFKFYENIKGKSVLAATKQFNELDNKAEVKFYTPAGKLLSEGNMQGKMYIGTWKYYQKTNNELLILEYYNNEGQLEGDRYVYYPNGQVAEKQEYKSGKLNGTSIVYSEGNQIIVETQYLNGELHGFHKNYNIKGGVEISGQYKNGKKDGVWYFYENDKLKEEKNFSENLKEK